MKTKFVLVGAVVAGVILFAWGAAWNMSLDPLVLKQFSNDQAVAATVRQGAASNGLYFSSRGVVAAVRMTPDMADQSNAPVGPFLVKEGLADLALGALLAMLVLAFASATVARDGMLLGLAGLAAGVGISFSDAIWFGFPWSYALLATGEQVFGWMLAGLALGALRRKLLPVAVPVEAAQPRPVAAVA
ncbi:MAG TPA: hypothetical protein VF092_22790 [Longimicrobium sp.]